MRYAVRALGWATKTLWILIVAFSATAAYSAANVRMGFGQPRTYLSSGSVVLSIPLFAKNSGFYDLSQLNLTVHLMDPNGTLLSISSTLMASIPRDSSFETAHNISINQDNATSQLQTYLFNDTVFIIDMSLKTELAYAIPFQVSMNSTIPWGAPLHNFSIGEFSYNFLNFTQGAVIIPISFENHSPFLNVDGIMQVETYNVNDELLGSTILDLNVPSQSDYKDQIELIVDVSKITGSGEVLFYFETSNFSIGPLVMQYG